VFAHDAPDPSVLRAADGTYYASGCPADPSGAVVFVESGVCSYNNSAGSTFNSSSQPGMFIVNNGTFALNGNSAFYGVIYAADAQGTSGAVVTVGGTASIQGGVLIDGSGQLVAGSSKINISFDDYAFSAVQSYGAAHIVQNKWRELTPSGA